MYGAGWMMNERITHKFAFDYGYGGVVALHTLIDNLTSTYKVYRDDDNIMIQVARASSANRVRYRLRRKTLLRGDRGERKEGGERTIELSEHVRHTYKLYTHKLEKWAL